MSPPPVVHPGRVLALSLTLVLAGPAAAWDGDCLPHVRLSDMGPDGSIEFTGFRAAAAGDASRGRVLVVWRGEERLPGVDEPDREIFGQFVDGATGAEIGANDFRISEMQPDPGSSDEARWPAVVWNATNDEFLVVWYGHDATVPTGRIAVFARRLDGETGAPLADAARISRLDDADGPRDAAWPAVAWNAATNEYLVVFRGWSESTNDTDVYAQRLDGATAAEIGDDFRISDLGPDGDGTFLAIAPDVACNPTDNEYLVVWYGTDDVPPLHPDEREIFGQRLDARPASFGEVGANDFRISHMGPDGSPDYGAAEPALAWNADANEYLVIWQGFDEQTVFGWQIFGQRLGGPSAAPVGDRFRVSEVVPVDRSSNEWPALAWNPAGGDYLAVWTREGGRGLGMSEAETFGRHLDGAAAAPLGGNERLSRMGPDGSGSFWAIYPTVAPAGAAGVHVAAWQGTDIGLAPGEREIFGRRIARDAPPCPGDLDCDGAVAFTDVLAVLRAWGPCPADCPEDVDDSGAVDEADLAALLSAWGSCG